MDCSLYILNRIHFNFNLFECSLYANSSLCFIHSSNILQRKSYFYTVWFKFFLFYCIFLFNFILFYSNLLSINSFFTRGSYWNNFIESKKICQKKCCKSAKIILYSRAEGRTAPAALTRSCSATGRVTVRTGPTRKRPAVSIL